VRVLNARMLMRLASSVSEELRATVPAHASRLKEFAAR
jgi:hypothetical protein